MYWKNDGVLSYGGVPLNVALGPRPTVGMPLAILPIVGVVVIPPVGVVIPPARVMTLYIGVGVVGVIVNVGGGGEVLIVVGG